MSLPRPHRILIPLAAFLAILPLLARGPSCGHDFDFHLLSWLEAATQYAHGGYPHWAFTPALNAGEPRFLFYPPLSWTLGALLTLVLPIQFTGTAFTFVALTLSGFAAYRLASRYAAPQSAVLCATLYLANPYMLFTAYERTAFGELLAAAWLPLLFAAALPHRVAEDENTSSAALRPKYSRRIVALALPIALLWLSNAPAAVMGCYALAILTLTQLAWPLFKRKATPAGESRLSLSLTTLAGTVLGLLLPAFYLGPAAYERRYVQISLATIAGMRPQDHFLFHRMPTQSADDLFHNAVVQTASIVSLILLAGVAAFWAAGRRTGRRAGAPDLASKTWVPLRLQLFPLTLIVAFLLTPPSLFLWNHTPQLAFLQFPWRLDALLAVVMLTLAAGALRLSKPALWLSPLLAIVLIFPAYTFFHQPCDATDTPTARAALFHSNLGTEPTDEYTPVTADNDVLQASEPWYLRCLDAHPDPNMPSSLMPQPGPAPVHIEHEIPCNALVVLNRRVYPDWVVFVNGHPATLLDPGRDDGRIAFLAPRGHLSLRLRWVRTLDQKLGLLVSALAVLIAALLWFWGRNVYTRQVEPQL